MVVVIILLSLGLIFLTLFLIEKVRRYSLKETLLKAITSLFFVSLGLYSFFAKTLSLMGVCFVLALSLGMLGDIFLDLKYVYRNDDKVYTYAGFIAFALGHVLYITGLLSQYYIQGNPLYIILPAVISVVIGTGNMFLGKFVKLDYTGMKAIVAIYCSILMMMLSTAFSMWMLHGFNNTQLLMMFIGGLLFVISDFILSGTYFGKGKERPVDIISNSVTYYFAQFIIAFSLFFI